MSKTSSEDYKKHLKNYYDTTSPLYDTIYTGKGRYPTGKHRLAITLAMIDEITPKPGVVLDAGCGDGRMVVELNKRGFKCTGFDLSDGMLELSKKNLEAAGLSADLIKAGDMYKIPAADHSVDLLLSMGVMENLDRHGELYREFKRVLKPGGRILISLDNTMFALTTFNKHTVRFFKSIYEDIKIPADIRDKVLAKFSEWMQVEEVKQEVRPQAMDDLRLDKKGMDLPVYHRLNVDDELRKNGFGAERLRFYHVHPLPPRFEKEYPEIFGEFAEKLETSQYDWRSTLLCNCMLVQAFMT